MPLLGQTMEEGTIIKWFKNEGDQIKAGEPLLEVMTDKVNMEVEAPENGVLRKILAQPDDIIPVKDPIAIIGTADESIDDLLGPAKAEPAPAPAPVEDKPAPVAAAAPAPSAPAAPAAPAVPVAGERLFASPSAKRVAREKGIDIAVLAGKGSGPGGRIVERDVLDYAASAAKATPLAGKMAADLGVEVAAVAGTGIGRKVTSQDIQRAAEAASVPGLSIGQKIPFSGLRKAVANGVTSSDQSTVRVTLVSEVDMTECMKMRSSIVKDIEARYGVRISFTDIIVKAAARAIEDKPIVNASIEGDSIVIHDHIHIGIATAVEAGLIVPVVRDVNLKSIPQISKDIKELAARARAGQSGPDDLRGGTFTVTNLGTYGVESFNPVITPGQGAILGVCKIIEKPVVVDGEIVVRSMMNLCLTFDHRVMDGAPAAEYLARLKEILQSPYILLL